MGGPHNQNKQRNTKKFVPKGKVRIKMDLVARRRVEVAELHLKGYTNEKVAERLGVEVNVVVADLYKIREDWKNSAILSYEQRKARHVARIEHLLYTAWQAYEKSIGPAETTNTRTEYAKPIPNPHEDRNNGSKKPNKYDKYDQDREKERREKDKAAVEDGRRQNSKIGLTEANYKGLVPIRIVEELKKVGQSGDPKYLEIILKCIEIMSKIDGLYKDGDKGTVNNQVVVVPWGELMKGVVPTQMKSNGALEDRSKVGVGIADGITTTGSNNNNEQLVEVDKNKSSKDVEVKFEEEEDEIERMIEEAGRK